MKKTYTIAVLGGDGIGPEVIGETVRLLDVTGLSFDWHYADVGFNAYKKNGTPLPKHAIDLSNKAGAILFGAVTTPPHIKNYQSPIVQLRQLYKLFANIRPVFSLPIQTSRKNIDFIIVRENTEDLYAGRERLTDTGATAERIITEKACRNILRYAFRLAEKRKRKKLTVAHKANVLRLTDGLFISIAASLSKKYPKISVEYMLVDSCAMKLIKNPEEFDVIATTNMFGDILSDEASALVGGLGVSASANIGVKKALFEPVHGSAPKYAGKNSANPLAAFYAGCMMLDFLGEQKTANHIRAALTKTLMSGAATKDLGGTSSMKNFTDRVLYFLKKTYDRH